MTRAGTSVPYSIAGSLEPLRGLGPSTQFSNQMKSYFASSHALCGHKETKYFASWNQLSQCIWKRLKAIAKVQERPAFKTGKVPRDPEFCRAVRLIRDAGRLAACISNECR